MSRCNEDKCNIKIKKFPAVLEILSQETHGWMKRLIIDTGAETELEGGGRWKKKKGCSTDIYEESQTGRKRRRGCFHVVRDKGRVWRRVGGGEECDGIHGTGTYIQIYSRGEVCNHFNDRG